MHVNIGIIFIIRLQGNLFINVYLLLSLPLRTRVNGRIVTERVQIKHGARILMGNNHLYRLSCPKRGGEDNNENEEPVMNYEQAMKEISVNELAAGGRSQTC